MAIRVKPRKMLFWAHLAAGVMVGSVVFFMAATGIVISFQRQIIAWSDTHQPYGPAHAGDERLDVEQLLEKARPGDDSGFADNVVLRAAPSSPALIGFGFDRTVVMNSYTGEVHGDVTQGTRGFFRTVTSLHRWLGGKDKNQAIGKAITGACALGFLFLILSGIVLWFPKKWTSSSVKASAVPNLALRGKARDWNLHNAIGIWLAPLMVVGVTTGVIMAYPWANNLLFKVAGSPPPQPQEGRRKGGEGARDGAGKERGGKGAAQSRQPSYAGLDGIWKSIETMNPGWQSMTLRLSPPGKDQVTISVDHGDGGRPDQRTEYVIDRKSGETVKKEGFADFTRGRQWRMWSRFIHTGEAFGWMGQLVAAIVSSGGMLLVWTGFALAWRRFFGKAARETVPTGMAEPMRST